RAPPARPSPWPSLRSNDFDDPACAGHERTTNGFAGLGARDRRAIAQQLRAIFVELLGCVAELVVEHPPHGSVRTVDQRQAVDAQDVAGVADRHLVASPANLRAAEEARAVGM